MKWVVTLSLSFLGLWFAFRGVDTRTVFLSIKNVRLPWVLMFLPLCTMIEYLMRAWRWAIFFKPVSDKGMKPLIPITIAGFFLNNALPFRIGEVARIWWSHQAMETPVSTATAVTAVDRLFDMMAILTIVVFVFCQRPDLFIYPRAILGFVCATVGGFLFLLWLAHFPGAASKILSHRRIPAKISEFLHNFIEGSIALRKWSNALLAYLISVAFWGGNIYASMLISRLFGLDLTYLQTCWMVVGFCFGTLIPSSPGFVGTLEAAGVAALGLLSIDKSLSLPYIITIHFVQILGSALWGVPAMFLAGLSVKSLQKQKTLQA